MSPRARSTGKPASHSTADRSPTAAHSPRPSTLAPTPTPTHPQAPASTSQAQALLHADADGKVPFDLDVVMNRIAEAITPFAKAAMFDLADQGFTSAFHQLVACTLSPFYPPLSER